MEKQAHRVVTVRGCKIILRPPNKITDLPLFYQSVNEQDITEFLQTNGGFSLTAEEQWFDGLAERTNDFVFAVCLPDDTAIGCMGLHRVNWIDRTAVTGSWLAKDYWGRGFGTDAKMHLLWFAYDRLNLRKICSAALAHNVRSIGHNQHCGYQIESTLKQQHFKNGQYHDLVQLACYREDWWPRFQAHLAKYGKS